MSNYSTRFSENSPAFVVTNEDLRYEMNLMPVNRERVLTVVGSGDHPLFSSLYGAKYVDTFDITINARAMMDVKTAAIIAGMRRSNYVKLLNYFCDNQKNSMKDVCLDNIKRKFALGRLGKNLSSETLNNIKQNKWNIVCYSTYSSIDQYSAFLPTKSEYQKLQEIINKPYNFIQTDIANLSAKLVGKRYDFIHLSNIFDHVDEEDKILEILNSLLSYVNVGGRILSCHFYKIPSIFEEESVSKILKDWRCFYRFTNKSDNVVVFERVR